MARGWDTRDVRELLIENGYEVACTEVQSIEDLQLIVQKNPNHLFWPACYTVNRCGGEICVASALKSLNACFVGCSSTPLKYSNKVQFKEKMAQFLGAITPRYCPVELEDVPKKLPRSLEYPIMVKTEFSCNSEGVRLAKNDNELVSAASELIDLYGQKIYLESWERSREFTVSVVSEEEFLFSAVELCCLNGAEYIDMHTKADNTLVKPCKVDLNTRDKLICAARSVCSVLKIDGHCRLDMLMNRYGDVHVIEINFQPFMSLKKHNVSYFPAAFEIDLGIQPIELISKILKSAIHSKQRNVEYG